MLLPTAGAEMAALQQGLQALLAPTSIAFATFDHEGQLLAAAGPHTAALLDTPAFVALVQRALAGAPSTAEIPLPAGPVFVHVAPRADAQGAVVGAVAVAAPAAPPRDNDEAFMRLFQASPVPISVSTLDRGVFSHCNDAFVRVFGYPRDEVVGHGSVELGMWTPEERGAAIGKLREKGFLADHESTVRTKQGDVRDTIFNMERIDFAGQARLVGFFFDITERKRAEAEQRRLYEQLRELDQLKSQLMANVSHELRTPLTLILGLAHRLLRESSLAQPQKTDLEGIQRNAQVLLKQVNDLLDVARLDSGLMQARHAAVDLAKLVRLVASPFEVIASDRGVAYVIEAPQHLTAEVDAEKIERILANLLSNAFKFTPRGGQVRCTLEAIEGERALLTVADSGPGIPAEHHRRVFERFYQVEGSATRRHGGTGLGLAIVREFAELHQGKASVGVSPEGGALLRVELPLRAPEGSRIDATATGGSDIAARLVISQLGPSPQQDPREITQNEGARPLVLVVEDNDEMRQFVATSLAAEYRVVTAADGEEGLEKAAALRPDLVLTDMMMPRKSGDQLVLSMRARPDLAAIPIVLLTARADDELRAKLLREGAQDYITKPFSVEELLARVGNQVALKRARDRSQLEKEAADRANQAKSEFLSSMSHELRTPLNGILGFAQILERSTNLSGDEHEGIQVIKRSGEHLLMLINDVLDLAKIEAGKMELSPRTFDLSAMLGTVTNISKVRAFPKEIRFAVETRGPAGLMVFADEKRVMQVLLNLLGNAIKFTERGRVDLLVDIPEASFSGVRAVRFRIEDTGPGIAAEHLDRIFEPFEQVGDEKAKSQGTGLGLSITRQLVAQMAGTLEVHSELGRGSTFTVTLPLADAPRSRDEAARPAWRTIAGYEGARRSILVVDDNAENRAVLRDLLAPLDLHVVCAEDGEAALAQAATKKPDLVVMDVAMPGMDGLEATRRLRAMPGLAGVVILACSAGLSESRKQACLAAGCDDFLAKPIDANVLLDQIGRRLGLVWVSKETSAAAPKVGADPLPSAEAIGLLLNLADQGRLQELEQHAHELAQKDPRLGPWVRDVRALANAFALDALASRLRADAVLAGSS